MRFTQRFAVTCALLAPLVFSLACNRARSAGSHSIFGPSSAVVRATPKPTYTSPVLEQLVAAAVERLNHRLQYDGTYY